MRLSEIQNRFKDTLLAETGPDTDSPYTSLFKSNGIAVSDRFAVYRNNVMRSLEDVLIKTYKVTETLVGDDFLRPLARQYIITNLPKEGNLDQYGARFAEFIARHDATQSLPYLGDVARLDRLCHESYIAPDDEAVDITTLHQPNHDDLGTARVTLRAAVRLIRSVYPLKDIRDFCLGEPGPEDTLDINGPGDHLLITRPHITIKITRIDHGLFAFLDALQNGSPILDSAQAAADSDNSFDVNHAIQTLFTSALVSGFHMPATESQKEPL